MAPGAFPEERSQIPNLRVGQIECRHAFVRKPFSENRSDQAALLVVEHNHRAHQIRTVIVSASIRAVAACALDDELLLAALDRIRWRHRPADQLPVHSDSTEPRVTAADHYASASLQNSKHFLTSVTESLAPRYSYSINARIGYFSFLRSSNTCLIGVSPWPHGMFGP